MSGVWCLALKLVGATLWDGRIITASMIGVTSAVRVWGGQIWTVWGQTGSVRWSIRR